jgi:hypothetical protein
VRALSLLFVLAALPACAFDVDGFSVRGSGSDASRDTAAGPDAASPDVVFETGIDTTTPIDIATICKERGVPTACFICCGNGYPKGNTAVIKRANSCVCGASVCATVCERTACKTGGAKDPDDACAVCVRDALAGVCGPEAEAARADEPEVAPYLGCATACR